MRAHWVGILSCVHPRLIWLQRRADGFPAGVLVNAIEIESGKGMQGWSRTTTPMKMD